MDSKPGIPVAPGVAIGPAFVLHAESYRIPDRFIARGSYPSEIARFKQALEAAAAEARQRASDLEVAVGAQVSAIFSAHAAMMEDPGFHQEVESHIRDSGYTPEYAVSKIINKRVNLLASLKKDYFAARDVDLRDLEKLLLHHLLGKRREPLEQLSQPVVLLAEDLTPSEILSIDRTKILGVATEHGGKTSHSAILAADLLQVPVVFGLGRILNLVSGGDRVIVDGGRGLLILSPDEETLERYERARASYAVHEEDLAQLRDLSAETLDEVKIQLLGNIEIPEEIPLCLERGCEGIGLYRTEFLYLDQNKHPNEEEQFAAYSDVVKQMAGRPVTIRTLDLGGDKFTQFGEYTHAEKNPFLGVRSIRLCLRNLDLFKPQLRAILRATAIPDADVRIMFPMISTLRELRDSKHVLRNVMEDLEEDGYTFQRKVKIGTMIEVPSAAIMAEQLAKEVDFFSIGTNDLIQYVLAADRTNENVATLYTPADPAVLRLIKLVVDAANKQGIEVSVCGEMGGDPDYTMLLVGLGLRCISAGSVHVPEVKQLIRSFRTEEAITVARTALQLETAREVNNYLREQTRRVLPQYED
ncbi:MAG: phosphoenolpyruvate--protein phosphotransferase [Planctomycetia bacterium]|nr:phosphoenolpyruvate--protein phosphotransferase [Planctomycetia bacterium]